MYEGLWVSSCSKSVEEYLVHTNINVEGRTQSEQRHKIMKCLSASPSKMMTVEELTDATGIVTYDKAFVFRKHLKRSFLTGKHALPIYIKDPPPGTSPSLKEELTLVILRHDSEVATFEKAVKWQKEITQKYSLHAFEQYNLIARETEMPTASVSTLKRRCVAPHSGHKNSQHFSNEAKIKFGKVLDTGTSIPSINLQYCREFAKMEQRKPFRFR